MDFEMMFSIFTIAVQLFLSGIVIYVVIDDWKLSKENP